MPPVVNCCPEKSCQRIQPIRIVGLPDGTWWAATAYSERAGGQIGEIFQKHRLSRADERELELARTLATELTRLQAADKAKPEEAAA